MPNEAIFIIDIETTGLRPNSDIVLQFGGILYDVTENRIIDTIEVKLLHQELRGHWFAMEMNQSLLLEMLKVAKEVFVKKNDVPPGWWHAYSFEDQLVRWLEANGAVRGKDEKITLTPCGKNAAGFDVPFINNLVGKYHSIKFRHRVLDVGSIMYDPKIHGSTLPDLSECLKLAGWPGEVAHTAIQDCESVLHCLRFKYHGIRGPYGEENRSG